MAKSPISLLQELAIKQGYFPIYDFMMSATKTNQFICKVICKDLSTDGVGNSKKEAKQKAAENMLLLLDQANQISMSSIISSLSKDTNKTQDTQNATMICNSSSSSTHLQLTEMIDIKKDVTVKEKPCINYIGLLQELCVQQKISIEDISYNVIEERGPDHMKYFIMEVNVKSARAQGAAQTKKLAKQEAAKNLLLDLGLNNLSEANNVSNESLEENMKKLGITISETKPTLPIAELSDKAQSIYLECVGKVNKVNKLPKNLLKNLHILFEDTYLTRIPYDIKKKMQMISIDQPNLIQEMRQYIEGVLKLEIKQFVLSKTKTGYVVGLRLLSIHNITQIGIGETKSKAETLAMYNIIAAILILLN